MQQHTTHLKLPFQFHEQKLVQELSILLDENWIAHFNVAGYSGAWKVIPLYSLDGDTSNIFSLHTSNGIPSETALLKKCPYLQEVIETFKVPILSARILRLGVGAEIKPHRDHELGYEDGNFRLHIPIITNPKVEFILDNVPLTMLPGECWYTNVNYVHSVKNVGTEDRFHLVIDGRRNAWSDQLFFSQAPKESFFPDIKEVNSTATLQRMIEELKRSNEPIAEQMIDELSTQLRERVQ